MNKKLLTAACAITIGCASATAQYSDIANGIANVLMPAVSGAANYKGLSRPTTGAAISPTSSSTALASTSVSSGNPFFESQQKTHPDGMRFLLA